MSVRGRVEICGGIASGKTTLAHLLADRFDATTVLENFSRNPFFELFYENPQLFVFEKNFCFLAQHVGEIKQHLRAGTLVCDFAVFQDIAYATMTKDANHVSIMESMLLHLYSPLPAAELIIHLRCNPVTQLQRIRARGRAAEQGIVEAYLDELNTAIDRRVERISRDTPILTLRSDQIDFASDVAAKDRVCDEIYTLFRK